MMCRTATYRCIVLLRRLQVDVGRGRGPRSQTAQQLAEMNGHAALAGFLGVHAGTEAIQARAGGWRSLLWPVTRPEPEHLPSLSEHLPRG